MKATPKIKSPVKNAALAYLEKRRATVSAPSGVVYTVRRVPLDQLLNMGGFPAAFIEAKAAGDKAASDEMIERDAELRRVITQNLVSAGVIAPFRIVLDSPQDVDPATNSVSIDEIEPDDQIALVNAISELNGLTQEAAEAVRPFPAEQAPTEGA